MLDPDAARYAAHACLFCGSPHGIDGALDREESCRTCGSPPFPAERHRLEYSGQRMLKRTPKHREIDLYVSWPQGAACAAIARVAHCKRERSGIPGAPERWIVGVEFLTLRFHTTRGAFVSTRA